jgi:hypothetical protein
MKDSPQPTEDLCRKYFTQLNNEKQYESLIRQALSMKDKWNTYSSPMEWLCRYYLEGRLDKSQLDSVGGGDSGKEGVRNILILCIVII